MPSSSTSSSQSDSNVPILSGNKRKKGVRNTHCYKHEVQKRQRLHGQQYVSTSTGNTIPAKSNTVSCSCKLKCTDNFSPDEKKHLLEYLYDGKSKNEQDAFLMGLIVRHDPKRRRSVRENPNKRDNVFKFFVLNTANKRIQVCRNAFSVLYAIKSKALFRLTTLLASGKSPVDKRGIHMNRGNTLPPEILGAIDDHIKEFPLYHSHYSSKNIQYLSSDLDIKTLHRLFCEKNPQYAKHVKYDFYRKYYNENYGYRFGRLQIDVCSMCEELETKIKSPALNDTAKRVAVAEKMVHVHRARKFYSKQREVSEMCKEKEDVGCLVFDYMQNLPLPKIPVQEMFYLRKLWLYVFCIHDVKTGSANFYTYPEGVAKRGPDEVCSLLWLKIQDMSPTIKTLHIFSDACGGQNRNNTLVRFLLALVSLGRFDTIHQYFPVRGHSFLQCDRNFGTAKRKIRKLDRIYTPDEYCELIRTARESGYSVRKVTSEQILDYKAWWPKLFKKSAKSVDKRSQFCISKYRHLQYSSTTMGSVTASEFIDGIVSSRFVLQKPQLLDAITLPTEPAYRARIPINEKKINDVKKIITYIPTEKRDFYMDIVAWPTTTAADEDE